MFVAVLAGRVSNALAESAKAKLAADYIFFLIDRVPAINSESSAGRTQPPAKVIQHCYFCLLEINVEWQYPCPTVGCGLLTLSVVCAPTLCCCLCSHSLCVVCALASAFRIY